MPQSHLRTKFFSVGKSSISIPSQLLAHVPAWNHHGDYNVHSQMCPVGEAVTHRHLIKLVLEGIGSSYCRTWEAAGFDSSRTTVFSSKIFSFSSACDPFVFFICVTYSMSLPFKTVAFYEVECCGVVPFGAHWVYPAHLPENCCQVPFTSVPWECKTSALRSMGLQFTVTVTVYPNISKAVNALGCMTGYQV